MLKKTSRNTVRNCFFILVAALVAITTMSCASLMAKIPSVAGNSQESGPDPSEIARMDDNFTSKVGYSWYIKNPSKDITVVGIVVVRNPEMVTMALMEEAKKLNADDIINIRIDRTIVKATEKGEKDREVILAASAVAIKYAQTLYVGGSESGSGTYGSGAVRWSRYTTIPNKDFTVAQIITVDCSSSGTPSADLMEKAKAVGAHDFINVLVDTKDKKIIGASATAIRYTTTTVEEERIPQVIVK